MAAKYIPVPQVYGLYPTVNANEEEMEVIEVEPLDQCDSSSDEEQPTEFVPRKADKCSDKCKAKCKKLKRKCKKTKKRCLGCCACCGILSTLLLVSMVITAGVFITGLRHAVHNCLEPKHESLSYREFDPNTIKTLNLEVTTGRVQFIEGEPTQTKVVVSVGRRSNDVEALSQIKESVNTVGEVATLALHTGPLDFQDCTQAHIIVTLPPNAMTINVKVQTGDVEFHHMPASVLDTVKVFVHTGRISFDNTEVKQAHLETHLGFVEVRETTFHNALNVTSLTGAVMMNKVKAHKTHVYTDSGAITMCKHTAIKNGDVDGEVDVLCEYGNLMVNDLRGSKKTNLKTTTGGMEVYFHKEAPFLGKLETVPSYGKFYVEAARGDKAKLTLETPDMEAVLALLTEDGEIHVDLHGSHEHECGCEHHHRHHHWHHHGHHKHHGHHEHGHHGHHEHGHHGHH